MYLHFYVCVLLKSGLCKFFLVILKSSATYHDVVATSTYINGTLLNYETSPCMCVVNNVVGKKGDGFHRGCWGRSVLNHVLCSCPVT